MNRLASLAGCAAFAQQNLSTFNLATKGLRWAAGMLILGLSLNTGRALYAEVVFFGDSLSDCGNLYLASGADVDPVGTPFNPDSFYSRFPTPPYNAGRATNPNTTSFRLLGHQIWTPRFRSTCSSTLRMPQTSSFFGAVRTTFSLVKLTQQCPLPRSQNKSSDWQIRAHAILWYSTFPHSDTRHRVLQPTLTASTHCPFSSICCSMMALTVCALHLQ